MEVIWYLKGTQVERPPYNTIRKFATRLSVPAPLGKKHSYLCCKVWEWYARTPLQDAEILEKYYAHESPSAEKSKALHITTSLKEMKRGEEKKKTRRKETQDTFSCTPMKLPTVEEQEHLNFEADLSQIYQAITLLDEPH